MKSFKTHNQQLQILRGKGLIITNASRAKRILERENYFSVINGYRDLFALSTSPFRFIPGTTFDEIFALYELDRELKNLYLRYLLNIEKKFQTSVAYYFSKYNKRNNRAYLDFRNFRTPANVRGWPPANGIHNTISMFSIKMSNEHNQALQHYITNHQEVPFWVLVNTLTMGEIGYIYYYLKDTQRLDIAQYYTKYRRQEYRQPSINITPIDIDTFLFFARHFRNACAHNERFYCKSSSRINNIKTLRDKMKDFLTKRDYNTFIKAIDKLFQEYTGKFSSISINQIKRKAGF